MADYSKMHEWDLAIYHEKALKAEDYETCQRIQDEVKARIKAGTINEAMMDGFKFFNSDNQQFEGKPKVEGLNGLFDEYFNQPPSLSRREKIE